MRETDPTYELDSKMKARSITQDEMIRMAFQAIESDEEILNLVAEKLGYTRPDGEENFYQT